MAEIQTKRRGAGARIALAVLVILVIIAGVILLVFRVRSIEISGTRRVSETDIKKIIRFDECHGNTLLLWLMNRKIDVSDIDMIESMDMHIAGPRTVRINVEEQLLVGFFRDGGNCHYVNENGLIILSQKGELEGVPEFIGLEVSDLSQGAYVTASDEAALADMLQIAAIVQETELSIEKLEVDKDGHYIASWQKIKALLGRNVYMNEKIGELKSLQQQPEVQGQAGTFHLEEYDATKDSIIFTKE